MDIKFACDKCGKHLVIDRAGAGITIDCPGCGQAVCVPSPAIQTVKQTGSQQAPSAASVKSSSGAGSSQQAFPQGGGQDLLYVSIDGEIQGPFTLRELADLYYKGAVPSDTLYSNDNSEHWHPISETIPILRLAQPASSHAAASPTVRATDSQKKPTTSSNKPKSKAMPTSASISSKPTRITIPKDLKPTPKYKKCPLCAEEILANAKKCRFCGEMLDPG